MTESSEINLQTVPKNPDQNWRICYLIEATYQLDRTLGLYKHWRKTSEIEIDNPLDEVIISALDHQMKLSDKTVGILMDQVYNGLNELSGPGRPDFEAFRKEQRGAS